MGEIVHNWELPFGFTLEAAQRIINMFAEEGTENELTKELDKEMVITQVRTNFYTRRKIRCVKN